MPAGRPSEYKPHIGRLICDRIASGDSVRTICADDDMPSDRTIYSWLEKYPDFLQQYARARELQAERYANEIIDISDEVPLCTVPDPDGGISTRVDAAGVQRNKLRVDARKWVAAKLLPKKYGDSTTLKGDSDNPLTVHYVAKSILDKGE